MASFYIHQDSDKENPRIASKEVKDAILDRKEKKLILNEVEQLKCAFREVTNIKNKKFGNTQQEQKKSFSKSDDCDKENLAIKQINAIECKNDKVQNKFEFGADNSLDTTPMSITDVLSPMSVDCSLIVPNETTITQHKCLSPKSSGAYGDRECFFEVKEYRQSILGYFRESEKKNRPKPNYMKRQTDINDSMRTILVDWLVEVSEEYNLDTETLHLSVSYIDRFLSHMSVVRGKLQLVGTAAMFIAAKYEEIYPPDVNDFVFITDDTYTKAQVLRMEQIILKILTFDLCTPTAFAFLNAYVTICQTPKKLKFLSYYICELTLLEADPYLRFLPSLVSAASLALARYMLGYSTWSTELEFVTTYRVEDMKEVLPLLAKTHRDVCEKPQRAIKDKYSLKKFEDVSSIPPVEIPEHLLNGCN